MQLIATKNCNKKSIENSIEIWKENYNTQALQEA